MVCHCHCGQWSSSSCVNMRPELNAFDCGLHGIRHDGRCEDFSPVHLPKGSNHVIHRHGGIKAPRSGVGWSAISVNKVIFVVMKESQWNVGWVGFHWEALGLHGVEQPVWCGRRHCAREEEKKRIGGRNKINWLGQGHWRDCWITKKGGKASLVLSSSPQATKELLVVLLVVARRWCGVTVWCDVWWMRIFG